MKHPRKVMDRENHSRKTSINFILFLLLIVYSCKVMAQNDEILKDKEKIHLTDFKRQNLNNQQEYPWFEPAYDAYHPDLNLLRPLFAIKSQISVLIFGGSWCDDTKTLLPIFYTVADAISIDSSSIRLIGVDRDKKSADGSEKGMDVQKVPCFIFYNEGKEIGRIIESVHKSMEEDMVTLYKPYF